MDKRRLLFPAVITVFLAASVYLSSEYHWLGLGLTAFAVAGATVLAGFTRPDTDAERMLGVGMLDDVEARDAVTWSGVVVVAYFIYIFSGLFTLGGALAFVAYAVTVQFLSVPEARKKELFLQRMGIAGLFLIAYLFEGLLLIPLVAVMARYTLIFMPETVKQSIDSSIIGDSVW